MKVEGIAIWLDDLEDQVLLDAFEDQGQQPQDNKEIDKEKPELIELILTLEKHDEQNEDNDNNKGACKIEEFDDTMEQLKEEC